MTFAFKDLLKVYEEIESEYGDDSFMHLSEVFIRAKALHKAEFKKEDHEQSWRAFKGHNLEKLIEHIILKRVGRLGLAIENGKTLVRKNLKGVLCKVKRNLLVDYGEYGCHLPDVDIVVYEPRSGDIVAVLSIKVSLRERIAQPGYWCLKLRAQDYTAGIKLFFITLDEDGDFAERSSIKKGRAIAEVDTDGVYVLSTDEFETSKTVKSFSQLIEDLQKQFEALKKQKNKKKKQKTDP